MTGRLNSEEAAKCAGNERGSTTTILLLVLLLLAAGGYLYYFTDLIRPKEAQKPQQAQNAPIKQPLPPRPPQPGEGVAPNSAAPQPGAVPPPAPVVPGATPAPPLPAAPPAKPEPAKVAKTPVPAPAAVAPKAPPAPAQTAAAPAPAKPAAAPAPAKPTATPVPAKPAVKPAAPAKEETAAAKPAPRKKQIKGRYALQVGDFVPDETLTAVEAKLRKNGITPVKRKVITAPEPMKRLFVAQFGDQDSAEAALQKLKSKTGDAFLVANNSKYDLYAGSYFSDSRVNLQLKRLAAQGVTPVVKQVQVNIKVTRLTAGSFATAEEAAGAVKRLGKAGVRAKVIKTGR